MYDIIFYHKNCADGVMAAWNILDKLIKDNLRPKYVIGVKASDLINIKQVKEDITTLDVIFVDIAPKLPDFELLSKFKSVLILDHHKGNFETYEENELPSNFTFVFDNDRSGCQLTEDYFKLDKESKRFWLNDYVGDRDLWKFTLPYCSEVNNTIYRRGIIYNIEKDFKYCKAANLKNFSLESFISEGKIHSRIQQINIEIDFMSSYVARFDSRFLVRVAFSKNNPSELAQHMYNTEIDGVLPDFVMIVSPDLKNKNLEISLRSKNDYGEDVATLAKRYGHDGHKHSAKIVLSCEKFRELISEVKDKEYSEETYKQLEEELDNIHKDNFDILFTSKCNNDTMFGFIAPSKKRKEGIFNIDYRIMFSSNPYDIKTLKQLKNTSSNNIIYTLDLARMKWVFNNDGDSSLEIDLEEIFTCKYL